MSKIIKLVVEGVITLDGNSITFTGNSPSVSAGTSVDKAADILEKVKRRMLNKSRQHVFSILSNEGRKMHVSEISTIAGQRFGRQYAQTTIENAVSDMRCAGHEVVTERTGRGGAFYRYLGKAAS